MGGSSSRQSAVGVATPRPPIPGSWRWIEERRAARERAANLYFSKLEAVFARVTKAIEDKNIEINVKRIQLNKKKTEYNEINKKLDDLTDEKNAKYINKVTLEAYKLQVEKHKKQLEYNIRLLETELADLERFINFQLRNKLYYAEEYNQLYQKVVKRNELQHKVYTDRNVILDRTINSMNQTYSNIHVDTNYQNLHNEYFMTLNAIFWWVYYLLFIVICYQIVYIQTELTLSTKIIWLTVLFSFPLLYYVYDLALMKI
jgi:hypothetical protein